MRGLGKVAPARDFTPPGGFAKDIRHTFYLSHPQTQLQLKSRGRSPLLLQVPGKRDVRQQRRYWQCSIRAPCSVPVQETSAFPPTPLLLTRADLGSRWAGAAFPWLGFWG